MAVAVSYNAPNQHKTNVRDPILQKIENAREMDALKRNLFNVRNELENAFRTTLHDLNVAYQEQAFDAMVQEALT